MGARNLSIKGNLLGDKFLSQPVLLFVIENRYYPKIVEAIKTLASMQIGFIHDAHCTGKI